MVCSKDCIRGRQADYQQMVNSGRVYPLVCEDEATGEPVGTLDLFKQSQDVMQHSMSMGMYVKPEYQGIGVGTLLMESMKTLGEEATSEPSVAECP